MTSPFEKLDLLRRVHAGAGLRAQQTWTLLQELAQASVHVPRKGAQRKVAEAIYFSSAYDACERYESVEEFLEELGQELDEAWPQRIVLEGEEHYAIHPFFSKAEGYLYQLGLGYLAGCRLEELRALSAPVVQYTGVEPVGLTEQELEAVMAYHHRGALSLVNALRHLRTALHYVRLGLDKYALAVARDVPLSFSPRVHEVVGELESLAAMPLKPAPKEYFGTEADRVNPLKSLPATEAELAFLLHEQRIAA